MRLRQLRSNSRLENRSSGSNARSKYRDQIAKCFQRYDDLIANNTRRIELLERSARLLFEEWFVRLRYPGHEHDKIVDGVPEGWQREHGSSDLSRLSVDGRTPSKEPKSQLRW